ncbi:hypothetical protein B0H10DRAFT_1928393 [Mycena sp. CBHHK59/15]|nr:hypothetical protein B0H10DRAFT_1928393 [Mycena sp. CBHHK59/15]
MDDLGFSVEADLTDEEWDRYLGHKRRWCAFQPLIEEHGYRLPKQYHPGRISAWDERPAGYVEEPHYPHLLEGVRISDNRPVMLKFSRTNLYEAAIFEHLASIPDADNHTIPLYDVLTPPGDDPEWCIMITPRLTDCRTPHLKTLHDFVNFLYQVLEVHPVLRNLPTGIAHVSVQGICFMHRYNVAHTCVRQCPPGPCLTFPSRDVARTNIVWDAKRNLADHSELKGKAPKEKKSPAPPTRYYFIDFGLACSYTSFEERGRVSGICGQHRNIPELSEEVPYDPFPLDIRCVPCLPFACRRSAELTCRRQIGEMLKRDYMEVYLGLEFLDPYIARLRDDDPTRRPTASAALAEFQAVVSALPEVKLNARLIGRDEWPMAGRIIGIFLLLWLVGNGTFLWWNWDRFNKPLPEGMEDLLLR